MRRPFYGTDIPGLQSTAAAPLPAPIVEADPYAEGYAAGYAAAMRERAVLRVRAVVEPAAPDPTADRAQVRALGSGPNFPVGAARAAR